MTDGPRALERIDLLRAGEHSHRAAHGGARSPAALPHAAREGPFARPLRARVHQRRPARRVGRSRQGLRVREGPLRRPHQGGFPGGGAREDAHRRHHRLREVRRDRRPVLRDALLPGPGERRRARVCAAARGHPRVGSHRHRQVHPARCAASRRARGDRRRAGADRDAVRRRARGHGELQLPGGRQHPQARARHGEGAGEQPRERMGSGQVHRSVPREPAAHHPGQGEGQGRRARADDRTAPGRSRRPDGAAAAQPRDIGHATTLGSRTAGKAAGARQARQAGPSAVEGPAKSRRPASDRAAPHRIGGCSSRCWRRSTTRRSRTRSSSTSRNTTASARSPKSALAVRSACGRAWATRKPSQFPEIAAALAKWARRQKQPVVLDGEIVALDADGRPTGFQQLQGRIHLAR